MRSQNWLLVFFAALSLCCGGTIESGNNAQGPKREVPAVAGANSVPSNAISGQQTARAAPEGNFAARTNRARPDEHVQDTPPPLTFQPAGEDSQFATAMNSSGAVYEVRVFNSHPTLAKVESIWIDAKSRNVTITLKDGQVRSVKTDAIPSLKQATTRQLIQFSE